MTSESYHYIRPDWPAPENIVSLCTLRSKGLSSPPFDSFNVALHVGDDGSDVEQNRQLILSEHPDIDEIVWLEQIHSNRVVNEPESGTQLHQADASITSKAGLACAVMTADCLPILLTDKQGQQIAAVHAGWRGMVAGVIENTVAQFTAPGNELLAWFGPAISARHFEVGSEVRDAFVASDQQLSEQITQAFVPSNKEGHFYADLYQLATLKLNSLGVSKLYGGECCTYADAERFYSYRRDGQTGRMVTLIYKKIG